MSKFVQRMGEVGYDSEHPTLEAAILDIIKHWPEDTGGPPNVYCVKDEEEMVAVTLAPIGSDKALAIYLHGQVDTYEHIHYVTDRGELLGTSFHYNGSSTATVIPHVK